MCLSDIGKVENGTSPLVLLVESDACFGKLLMEVLSLEIFPEEQIFYQVKRVANAQAALQVFRCQLPVCCVFEDNPPYLDGLDLYKQMCAIKGSEQIPALLIGNDLSTARRARQWPISLQKPFDLERFIELVQEMIATVPRPDKNLLSCQSGVNWHVS